MRCRSIASLALCVGCGSSGATSGPSDAQSDDVTSSDALDAFSDARSDAPGDALADAKSDVDAKLDAGETIDRGPEPATTTSTFTASSASFSNPERGWMEGGGIAVSGADDDAGFRAAGYALVYGKVRLDAWRSKKTIDASRLSDLDAGFANARKAGIKVVLRFVYNDGPGGDAPLDVVLAHIGQLGPIVTKNVDVVAVWQAGFIGQWGEWHDSTNGLDTSSARKSIVDALLAAMPTTRMTQVRVPMHKADWFPTALDPSHAFDGSEQARIGHHDDCFLADVDDYGTYASPIDTWKKYVSDDTRFTPHGGETCPAPSGSTARWADCAASQTEMALLHTSFLNNLWDPNAITFWRDHGCLDAIGNALGYRLALEKVEWSAKVRPGGALAMHFELENKGYSAPFNPRAVRVVITNGTTTKSAVLPSIEWRSWSPSSAIAFDAKLRIPATLAAGNYSIALWLPDDADAIRDRPEYAVRLANDGVWDAAHGWNVVTKTLAVDPSATGSYDPTATDFAPIP